MAQGASIRRAQGVVAGVEVLFAPGDAAKATAVALVTSAPIDFGACLIAARFGSRFGAGGGMPD